MGRSNKNKGGAKSAPIAVQSENVDKTVPNENMDKNLIIPEVSPALVSKSGSSSSPMTSLDLSVSSISSSSHTLQNENEELKRRLSLVSSERDRISAELREKDKQLLEKTTDLSLVLTFVDEIDAHIEISKKELLCEDQVVDSKTTATEGDLSSVHAKRIVDLISILTNTKAQLSSKTAELSAADLKIEELHAGIQSLQTRFTHLGAEHKRERDQLLELTEELNQRNRDIERLEDEKVTIYNKYKNVLERSLDDLEVFRTELRDTISELDASNNQLATMEAAHAVELEHLKTDTEEAKGEWKEKEGVYQNELAQLREAIRLLECDKKEGLDRFHSELETTREELLEAASELNQSLNTSIGSMRGAGGGDERELSRMSKSSAVEKFNLELDTSKDELLEPIDLNNSTVRFNDSITEFVGEEEEDGEHETELDQLREQLREQLQEQLREAEETHRLHLSVVQSMLEGEVTELKQQLECAIEERDALRLSHQEVSQKLAETVEAHQAALSETEAQLWQVKQQLSESEKSRGILTESCAHLEATNEERISEISDMQEEIAEAKKAWRSFQNQVSIMKQEMAECSAYSAEVEAQRDGLLVEVEQLKIDLSEARNGRSDVEVDLENAKQEFGNQRAVLEAELEALKESHAAAAVRAAEKLAVVEGELAALRENHHGATTEAAAKAAAQLASVEAELSALRSNQAGAAVKAAAELAIVEAELAALRHDYDSASAKAANTAALFGAERAALEAELEALRNDRDGAAAQFVTELAAAKVELTTVRNDHAGAVATVATELATVRAELLQLSSEKDDVDTSYSTVLSQLKDMQLKSAAAAEAAPAPVVVETPVISDPTPTKPVNTNGFFMKSTIMVGSVLYVLVHNQ